MTGDSQGRVERVDVIDPSTGAVLASRTLSSFAGGVFLSWQLTGNVQLRFTPLAGPNAVVSGLFFPSPPAAPSASFVKEDTATQGTGSGPRLRATTYRQCRQPAQLRHRHPCGAA